MFVHAHVHASPELQSLHGSANLGKIQDSGGETKAVILFHTVTVAFGGDE